MADIIYPTGCRPLTEDLGTDELIRRLKTLAHNLQSMDQEEADYQKYIPLALHIADDYFLHHSSKDVKLLVACCIADILRIFAPEPPYRDQEQIRIMFMFFINQLRGLRDPKDPCFKRYFYLLENLAYVKSFNMCFDIDDSHKIFYELFTMFFRIINEEHSSKVKNFMIDIMGPLTSEASPDLLDVILINIVEPNKSQNKHAFQLAEQLIIKNSDLLEPAVKLFFNQALIMDGIDRNLAISNKLYDLIYELNVISSDILVSVLPQLECKLKSTNETERLKAVALLARMFSEKDSQLSKKHAPLQRMLFGRFCDIAVSIRIKCVQSSMHFLLNQPHLRKEITDCLRTRQHDSDENVRYEVVMAIVETAKRDFKIVVESEALLEFVRERTLDKKFKIRKEALNGLGFIYKQVICEPNDLSADVKRSVDWLKNKVLHGYYMPTIEDRIHVERLLITCLVPYKLPPLERMKKLYHLLGTLDENATKSFIELQKNQLKIRKTVQDWVKLHHTKDLTPKLQTQINAKMTIISKLLPDPVKANEFLTKFSVNMRKDPSLLRCMEIILKRDVSCKECADTMSVLLKKLGTPIMTNVYYNTVKMLIERIASVMVDKESLSVLIGLIEECMRRTSMVDEVGIRRSEAGEAGLKLLVMLSYVFAAHFFSDTTLRHMISLLSYNEEYVAPLILKTLSNLGRYRPLGETFPDILDQLAPICKEFALSGTVKQAKHAVRCIFINSQSIAYLTELAVGNSAALTPNVHPIFNEIIETLKTKLSSNCENQQTKIVSLGHIAFYMPQAFLTPIKNMIARRIVKDLLIQAVPEKRDDLLPEGDWCAEEDLPQDTICKLDALKTMARWLLGLRSDEHAAQKTFRMLSAFVTQRGDLLEQNRLCPAEKSWLCLSAACAMLKVCEQKGVGDQYSAEQYYSLSRLMIDPVPGVREIFARKLHKGLQKGLPNKCLPLDFMGFYVLCGHETDKKLLESARHFVETDVNRRREYLKTVSATTPDSMTETQKLYLLPDFMLAFAITVLSRDPKFTNHEDPNQLKQAEKCLRFIMEPLMAKRDAFSFSFYKNLIEMLKSHQDITENESYNLKIWALCDLALYVIYSKMAQFDPKASDAVFSVDIQLPTMFFKPYPEENTKIYIPLDIYTLASGAPSKKHQTTAAVTAVAAAAAAAAATHTVAHTTATNHKMTTTSSTLHSPEKRSGEHFSSNENSPTNNTQNDSSPDNIFDGVKASTDEDTSEPLAKKSRPAILRSSKK